MESDSKLKRGRERVANPAQLRSSTVIHSYAERAAKAGTFAMTGAKGGRD
jgi:hypothetical protein